MTHHPNAFRPQGPTKVDLSRLPAHLREAIDRPVEMRPGEIRCSATVHAVRALCQPAARVYAQVETSEEKMVGVKVLDTRGVDVIAQLEISPQAQETLLSRFVEIYKALGGTKDALLDMYEGIPKHE